MSTFKLETYVPRAGVGKPKSRLGLMWDRLTRKQGEPPFKELPEYHIRVVKIKPGDAQHPLRLKLQIVDPRNFKYTALSYCWDLDHTAQSDASYGPVGVTQSVPVSGTDVKISQSLYDALCQIRDVQSDVPIFVDALCINFEDERERTEYLEIMGHIYARAASVVVWLGKKDRESNEIMLIMRKLVNAIDWRKIGDGSAYNFRDPRFFSNIGMEPLTLKQWRQIHDFCQMRWFTRYWAFFELALAKNALFLWGEACMEYNFLVDFGMILGLSGWLEDLRNFSNGEIDQPEVCLTKMLGPVARLRATPPWHPKHNEYTVWMRENYQLETDQQRAWKFFEIMLQSAEAFDCRDPRDRFFAPLALARHVFGGKAMNKQWPQPDYRKSAEDITKSFTELILQHTGQPSILAADFDPKLRKPQAPQQHEQEILASNSDLRPEQLQAPQRTGREELGYNSDSRSEQPQAPEHYEVEEPDHSYRSRQQDHQLQYAQGYYDSRGPQAPQQHEPEDFAGENRGRQREARPYAQQEMNGYDTSRSQSQYSYDQQGTGYHRSYSRPQSLQQMVPQGMHSSGSRSRPQSQQQILPVHQQRQQFEQQEMYGSRSRSRPQSQQRFFPVQEQQQYPQQQFGQQAIQSSRSRSRPQSQQQILPVQKQQQQQPQRGPTRGRLTKQRAPVG